MPSDAPTWPPVAPEGCGVANAAQVPAGSANVGAVALSVANVREVLLAVPFFRF